MRGGTIRPSQRAIGRMVQPCSNNDAITTTKVTLKISRPVGNSATMGRIASRIETAPRSPTQATKVVSLRLNPNGTRQSQTATGRPTSVRNRARSTAGTAMPRNCEGAASNPSVRNMAIWLNQVMPS